VKVKALRSSAEEAQEHESTKANTHSKCEIFGELISIA
jgi:hypothetical protein